MEAFNAWVKKNKEDRQKYLDQMQFYKRKLRILRNGEKARLDYLKANPGPRRSLGELIREIERE